MSDMVIIPNVILETKKGLLGVFDTLLFVKRCRIIVFFGKFKLKLFDIL